MTRTTRIQTTKRRSEVEESDVIRAIPEHDLLIALIVGAIHDVTYAGCDSYALNVEHIRRSAVSWLTRRDEACEPWSYVWCCDHLMLDPDLIKVKRVSHLAQTGLPDRFEVTCRGIQLGVSDQAGLRPVRSAAVQVGEYQTVEIDRLVWLGDLLSEQANIARASEQPLELGKLGGTDHEV